MDKKTDAAPVLDLQAFREKKKIEDDVSRGRTPLYVSHLDGSVKGSPHFKGPAGDQNDFASRMQRIKASLEKINSLMAELKNNKEEEEKVEKSSKDRRK